MRELTIYNKVLENELEWMFEGIYENVEECIKSIDIRIIENILMKKSEYFIWIEINDDGGYVILNSILGAIGQIDYPNVSKPYDGENVKDYEKRLNEDNPDIRFNVAKAGHIRLQINNGHKHKAFREFIVKEVVADIAESKND